MNRALFYTILMILIIVSASNALAEVAVISSGTTTQVSSKTFLVENTNSGIKIEAATDVGATYIYVNGKLIEKYDSFASGSKENIRFDRSIENEVEIRFLKDYVYTWNNYDVTKDDTPIKLKYLKYDKDEKAVKFTLGGADMLHPSIIDSTKKSVEASFTNFKVKVDDEYNLNCYPKISTGKDTYFKCKSSTYPHVIDITATLGVSEKTTIGPSVVQVSGDSQQETVTVVETPEIIVEEVVVETVTDETNDMLVEDDDQGNTSAPEETTMLDNISMSDTILDSEGMSNAVRFFILALFLAVLSLFFIASHHKHENKKAGVHHPHKKKKNKK